MESGIEEILDYKISRFFVYASIFYEKELNKLGSYLMR